MKVCNLLRCVVVLLTVLSAEAQARPVRPAPNPVTTLPGSQDFGVGWSGRLPLVSVARKYVGTNPTGYAHLWCTRFLNLVLAEAGYKPLHSNFARSYQQYGRRVDEPHVGAIAVLWRKGGGHAGVVAGISRKGNPIIISGNNSGPLGRRVVGVHEYSKARVLAYVVP